MTHEELQNLRKYLPRVLVSGTAADVARDLDCIQDLIAAVERDMQQALDDYSPSSPHLSPTAGGDRKSSENSQQDM